MPGNNEREILKQYKRYLVCVGLRHSIGDLTKPKLKWKDLSKWELLSIGCEIYFSPQTQRLNCGQGIA